MRYKLDEIKFIHVMHVNACENPCTLPSFQSIDLESLIEEALTIGYMHICVDI